MAVKSSPVVGVVVMPEPNAEVAASSIVSIVSRVEQADPLTRTPPTHSTTTWGVPIKTVPVRSIPTGRSIAWFVESTTSNPLSPPDP